MSLPIPASFQNSTKMKNHSSLLCRPHYLKKSYNYCGPIICRCFTVYAGPIILRCHICRPHHLEMLYLQAPLSEDVIYAGPISWRCYIYRPHYLKRLYLQTPLSEDVIYAGPIIWRCYICRPHYLKMYEFGMRPGGGWLDSLPRHSPQTMEKRWQWQPTIL